MAFGTAGGTLAALLLVALLLLARLARSGAASGSEAMRAAGVTVLAGAAAGATGGLLSRWVRGPVSFGLAGMACGAVFMPIVAASRLGWPWQLAMGQAVAVLAVGAMLGLVVSTLIWSSERR